MANIGAYGETAMLNWALGGTTVTQPTTRAVGLSTGTPTNTSAFEISTGSGYARQLATFAAAAAPTGTGVPGSASNANAMTFGPFSALCTVSGMQIWDNASIGSGNMWWYGQLAAARTFSAGDSLVLNAGSLVITLS